MIKKVLKVLDMFGYLILSFICFLIAIIVMDEMNVDSIFLYELSNSQLSVVVFVISGVIFLVLGLIAMIYEIIQLSFKEEENKENGRKDLH